MIRRPLVHAALFGLLSFTALAGLALLAYAAPQIEGATAEHIAWLLAFAFTLGGFAAGVACLACLAFRNA